VLRLRRGELHLEIAQDIDADQEGSESDLFDGDGHIARVPPGHLFSKVLCIATSHTQYNAALTLQKFWQTVLALCLWRERRWGW
jgi:hypothetical protein